MPVYVCFDDPDSPAFECVSVSPFRWNGWSMVGSCAGFTRVSS